MAWLRLRRICSSRRCLSGPYPCHWPPSFSFIGLWCRLFQVYFIGAPFSSRFLVCVYAEVSTTLPWRYNFLELEFHSLLLGFFFLSPVMIAWDLCLNVLDMGMSHNPYALFLCNLNISLLSLRLLISFLSKMEMQSLSHSLPKEISEPLCSPSKLCTFVVCGIRLLDNGMFPVCVIYIVKLFGNCTSGPLCVSFISVITNWYSVR